MSRRSGTSIPHLGGSDSNFTCAPHITVLKVLSLLVAATNVVVLIFERFRLQAAGAPLRRAAALDQPGASGRKARQVWY